MATPPVMAAPQPQPHPHVVQYVSEQPIQSQGVNDRIDVKRQVAKETERQLLCLEALLQLSQSKCHGIDLSGLLSSLSKASRPNKLPCLVDSGIRSNATAHPKAMQPATLGPTSATHPATVSQVTPCHSAHFTQPFTPAPSTSPAMSLPPERRAAEGSSREASEPAKHQCTMPSSQDPAHHSDPQSDKGPENASAMGLRKERKRNVLMLLDEDPEWATEVLKKTSKKQSTAVGKPPAETPAELGPDLQNASQHIVQRRGVYFKIKEKAFEAQLDTARYRKNLAVEIPGPNVWYLGLFRVESSTLDHLRAAQDRATRTVDRGRVKLLQSLMSEHDLRRELHFPLEDYLTEKEITDRKDMSMKDYCNLLKHNADARRAQHGGKGVAARRRMNGAISYEARISKHNVGTFGTYASLEEAKYAYDVGAIICKGTDYRLNYHLSRYMANGVFLPDVHVPEPLKTIIQAHVNNLCQSEVRSWLKRVERYYQAGQCPFYSPSPTLKGRGAANKLPYQGWSAVVNSTAAAENVQLSAAPKGMYSRHAPVPDTAKPSAAAEKVHWQPGPALQPARSSTYPMYLALVDTRKV